MKLAATVALLAGGPGSGPRPGNWPENDHWKNGTSVRSPVDHTVLEKIDPRILQQDAARRESSKVSVGDALKRAQWKTDLSEMGAPRSLRGSKKRKKLKSAGQTDSSSFIGRKYRVVDTKYGHEISEHDNPEDADHAAQARPYSKVLSYPNPAQTPEVRDIARQRLVKTNPDVD